jgi:hypothetical protein
LSMLNTPRVPTRSDLAMNGFLSSFSLSSEIGAKENGSPDGSPIRIQLPTSLIVRASCGSPHHFSDLSVSTSDSSF